MTDHVDRIPPLQLTLEDALRVTVAGEGRWAPVIGLVRTSDRVIATVAGLDAALALPAQVPVIVMRGGESGLAEEEVDEAMSGWYAGDLGSAGEAVSEHDDFVRAASRAGEGPRRFTLERDPSLVGIYGGDLDHIMDAMGSGTTDEEARTRRAQLQRVLAEAAAASHAPQPGEPETDEITEAVEARMAGWYAGDAEFVREHKDEH